MVGWWLELGYHLWWWASFFVTTGTKKQTMGAVLGAATNSFSLQWGKPTELKGTVWMLLQFLNSKHPSLQKDFLGRAGGNGMAQLECVPELLGWSCPLVVRDLGTPWAKWLQCWRKDIPTGGIMGTMVPRYSHQPVLWTLKIPVRLGKKWTRLWGCQFCLRLLVGSTEDQTDSATDPHVIPKNSKDKFWNFLSLLIENYEFISPSLW